VQSVHAEALLCAVMFLPAVEPLIQLPALPGSPNSSTRDSNHSSDAAHSVANSSSSSGGGADPPCSSSDTAASPARRRVLHVFWDLSSLHPGGYDPRILVSQLRRVLECYGDVAGVYAYGIQKLFNWIPEAFMLQYAPDRLPGTTLDPPS
jgi:hypothetical protein